MEHLRFQRSLVADSEDRAILGATGASRAPTAWSSYCDEGEQCDPKMEIQESSQASKPCFPCNVYTWQVGFMSVGFGVWGLNEGVMLEQQMFRWLFAGLKFWNDLVQGKLRLLRPIAAALFIIKRRIATRSSTPTSPQTYGPKS